MGDMLGDALVWLSQQRHANASIAIAYSRGTESLAILASVGSTSIETADEDGAVIEIERRDFLVRASDLVLTGLASPPEPGDQITYVHNDVSELYEVVNLSQQEGCYREVDLPSGTFRIHTRRITRTPS